MKKGSKLSDKNYTLEIRNLSRENVFSSTGSSLRELVRTVKDFIPTMETYSKVYRHLQENLGGYVGLFVLPVAKKQVRHVVVTIQCDTISDADWDRWYERAKDAPTMNDDEVAAAIDKIESLEAEEEAGIAAKRRSSAVFKAKK